MRRRVLARSRQNVLSLLLSLAAAGLTLHAQGSTGAAGQVDPVDREPMFFSLREAPSVTFPAGTDSNSPAFWDRTGGSPELRVLNSAGHPSIARGERIWRLSAPREVVFTNEIDGGRWMEAVIQDAGGTLYGYYHNEPASVCEDPRKTAPRIGAARSFDGGYVWEDLGIVIEAPRQTILCDTPNHYFYGGVGDFSVVLNPSETDAYFFFSTYAGDPSAQGIGVARLAWHHRDAPQGRIAVWDGNVWRYPTVDEAGGLEFAAAGPIFPTLTSWHDPSGRVDALWGPSVHWNTHLGRYVMLANRASDWQWTQEGVYISSTPTLDDPTAWSKPMKVVDGGAWYPQVIGLEPGTGTDKLAGRVARLFVAGLSQHFIVFESTGP